MKNMLDYEVEVKGLNEEIEDLIIEGTVKGAKGKGIIQKSTVISIATIFAKAMIKAGSTKNEEETDTTDVKDGE